MPQENAVKMPMEVNARLGLWVRFSWILLPCLLLIMAACESKGKRTWQDGDGYRMAALPSPGTRKAGFTELSARSTGIHFANTIERTAWSRNRHMINGSGVALGDVDGDGRSDVFLASIAGANALFLNRGDWRFEPVAVHAAVADSGAATTGAVLADIDGDGDLDLLLTSLGGGAKAFLNDGNGTFSTAPDNAGLVPEGGATSMALADVEGDGDLDLYVAYYKVRTVKDLFPPEQLAFERVVRQEGDRYWIDPALADHYRLVRQNNRLMRLENAEPDRFYLNRGDGYFVVADMADGTFTREKGQPLSAAPEDWALSVRFQDFDGDGYPDLYVCNDFESPDHFWLGDGQGGFRAAPFVSIRKSSQSTMSIAAGDVDADGFVDLFLADMLSVDYQRRQRQYQVIPPEVVETGDLTTRPQIMQNMLLLGRGDGTFAEVARAAGVAASEWTWSSVLLDVDLDGYEDLLLTTGHAYDAMDGDAQMRTTSAATHWRERLFEFPDLDLPNLAFRNQGDGVFSLISNGWGLATMADVSHGMALADLDQDGDLDAVINRLNAPAGVFRNDAAASRIAVRLRGLTPNTRGVGALIRVSGDALPVRQKEMLAGGLYLSSSEPLYTFAAEDSVMIRVRWRSGRSSIIPDMPTNHLYEVFERDAMEAPDTARVPESRALMAEVPLALMHQEARYDDFARQPLLPQRLSQRGPAIALADLDADGDEDIVMGSGRGGHLMVARNHGGTFEEGQPLGPIATGDHAGVVVMPDGLIIVARSNYERTPENATDASAIALMRMQSTGPEYETIVGADTPGPLVLADFDGNGALDLFVGGHFLPGRYPAPASSRIYRGGDGQFVHDEIMSAPFAAIGLVSGAAAGDLDGDGDTDLVLATDWGPVRVLINQGQGRFSDHTHTLGLDEATGRWNGVALGDFDGDGHLDLVATNWGTNTIYAPVQQPLVTYYGDLDRNGIVDILETRYDATLQGYGMVRDFRVLSQAIPSLWSRVRSYRAFAARSAEQLFHGALGAMQQTEAATLRSMLFLRRGNRYEAVPLPPEAQWAPAFAPVVADFDGDGAEDLLLSQNNFAVPLHAVRMDAGRGLLLRGNGRGRFVALSGQASGITAYGEQRGAAAADLDQDGRTDVIITQNAAAAKLFMNRSGVPGLRVMIQGRMGGVGATLRIRYADGTLGPARVVSAGTGYWSQHALTQTLGIAAPPKAVWVRWPNGAVTETPVPEGQRTITIVHGNAR